MQHFLTIHSSKNITCLYQCPFLWPFLVYITVLKNRWNWKKVFCFISNAVLHKFLRTLKLKNFTSIKRTTLTHQNTSIFISQEGGGNRYFFSEGYGLFTVLEQPRQFTNQHTVGGTLCTCLTQHWEPVAVQVS